VVRELVEGDDSVGVVAARRHLSANMVSGWRKRPFDNAQVIFAQDQRIREVDEERREHGREVDDPSRTVGQPAVERDHLQRGLGKRLDGLGLQEGAGRPVER
jgi:hypothetical protein